MTVIERHILANQQAIMVALRSLLDQAGRGSGYVSGDLLKCIEQTSRIPA